MRKRKIAIGDRLVKVDDPKTVWIVDSPGSAHNPIPHYQLVMDGNPNRRRTLSENVLADRDFYRPSPE
ncbi:MAG: hypothetical protein ACPGOV_12645 [Magnetovibrionaceae bacterium]